MLKIQHNNYVMCEHIVKINLRKIIAISIINMHTLCHIVCISSTVLFTPDTLEHITISGEKWWKRQPGCILSFSRGREEEGHSYDIPDWYH